MNKKHDTVVNNRNNEVILQEEIHKIGHCCYLCDTVYDKLFECKWQTRLDKRLQLRFICKDCYSEMNETWLSNDDIFDSFEPESLPCLTGRTTGDTLKHVF